MFERDLRRVVRDLTGQHPDGLSEDDAEGLREAIRLGDGFIGTEHVLLGLIRTGDPERRTG